jgi:hypothetical protein
MFCDDNNEFIIKIVEKKVHICGRKHIITKTMTMTENNDQRNTRNRADQRETIGCTDFKPMVANKIVNLNTKYQDEKWVSDCSTKEHVDKEDYYDSKTKTLSSGLVRNDIKDKINKPPMKQLLSSSSSPFSSSISSTRIINVTKCPFSPNTTTQSVCTKSTTTSSLTYLSSDSENENDNNDDNSDVNSECELYVPFPIRHRLNFSKNDIFHNIHNKARKSTTSKPGKIRQSRQSELSTTSIPYPSQSIYRNMVHPSIVSYTMESTSSSDSTSPVLKRQRTLSINSLSDRQPFKRSNFTEIMCNLSIDDDEDQDCTLLHTDLDELISKTSQEWKINVDSIISQSSTSKLMQQLDDSNATSIANHTLPTGDIETSFRMNSFLPKVHQPLYSTERLHLVQEKNIDIQQVRNAFQISDIQKSSLQIKSPFRKLWQKPVLSCYKTSDCNSCQIRHPSLIRSRSPSPVRMNRDASHVSSLHDDRSLIYNERLTFSHRGTDLPKLQTEQKQQSGDQKDVTSTASALQDDDSNSAPNDNYSSAPVDEIVILYKYNVGIGTICCLDDDLTAHTT